MRKISKVYLHCSASSDPDVNGLTMETALGRRGFEGPGFHYFITAKGQVQNGLPLTEKPPEGLNGIISSVGICLAGREPEDFTLAQFDALRGLADRLTEAYEGLTFHGIDEVREGEGPIFDYGAALGLDKKGKRAHKYRTPVQVGQLSEDVIEASELGE